MQISRGKKKGAQKIILYAPEGWGKSTAASMMPDPLFIDTEGSTKMLDVARIEDDYSNWQTILDAVDYVIKESPGACKTLVIDTTDWAEQACLNMLNVKHHTDNILTLDYGRGSLYIHAEFSKLLNRLDKLIDKDVNVVLLAHAIMRKQELPEEMGAFDRWELKLQSKQVKAQLKEWADAVLFGNYKTIVVKDSKTKSNKAQGGKRVIYTAHTTTWDAKNRHGMPEIMDLDYAELNRYLFLNTDAVSEKKEAVKPENVQKAEKKDEKPPKSSEKGKKADDQEKKTSNNDFTEEQLKARAEEIKKLEGIPPELKKLMLQSNVSDWDLQGAVGALKNPYDSNTPIQEYSESFVNDMMANWDKVVKKVEKIRDSEEIPFR